MDTVASSESVQKDIIYEPVNSMKAIWRESTFDTIQFIKKRF